MTAKQTYINYFPSNATEVLVKPDLQDPVFACFVPEETKTIAVEQTENDFFKRNCSNGCPFFLDARERLKDLRDKGYSTLEAKEAINREAREQGLCTASQEEMHYDCRWIGGYREQTAVSINALPSLWVHQPNASKKTAFQLYIASYSEQFGVVHTLPYQMANVYDNAGVCWGKDLKKPGTLREAFNTFWNSVFNHNIVREHWGSLAYALQTFTAEDVNQNWKQEDFSGYIRVEGPKDGVVLSQAPQLLEQIPTAYRQNGLACGFFTKFGENWLLNFNGYLMLKTGSLSASGKFTPLGTLSDIQQAL
ncbi:MAG: hypothetical protein ABEK59_00885 [Halobacteria archaeon]